MKEQVASFLRRLLRRLLAVVALIAVRWRLWLTAALFGALLFGARAALEPRLWASQGEVTLRPLVLREGYLLSVSQLTANYALRLREESRVARALTALGIEEEPRAAARRVTTWTEPTAGLLYLRVEDTDSARAEALARNLLADFQTELEEESRTRGELDRMVISVSPTSFARPVNPSPIDESGRGFVLGLSVGLALALAQGWFQHGRVRLPLEAEQLTGAPTLGAIPRR